MTTSIRPVALSAVLVAVLALTGCGGSDSSSTEQPVAAGSSSSVPSAAPDGSAPLPTPGISASRGPDGSSPVGRPLPDGFPVGEIPVAKGTVVDAATGEPGSPVAFSLLVSVAGGSPSAVMDRIAAQMKRAGFSAAAGVGTSRTATSTFTSSTYDVGVNVIKADGGLTASYVVVRKNG